MVARNSSTAIENVHGRKYTTGTPSKLMCKLFRHKPHCMCSVLHVTDNHDDDFDKPVAEHSDWERGGNGEELVIVVREAEC